MCTERAVSPPSSGVDCQGGFTLIELIVFIVIVSSALAGVLLVLNNTVKSSADPMIRKQMLAIAEGLLEEVSLQPFTWCDPNDVNAGTAATTTACAGGTPAETRTSTTDPFDNVLDYNGASITSSLSGVAFPSGYSASVAVVPEALNGIAAGAALRITVTASFGGDSMVLEGYRTRYAPNSLP